MRKTSCTCICHKHDEPNQIFDSCDECANVHIAESLISIRAGKPMTLAKRGDKKYSCYVCKEKLDAYEIHPTKFENGDIHKTCWNCHTQFHNSREEKKACKDCGTTYCNQYTDNTWCSAVWSEINKHATPPLEWVETIEELTRRAK